MRFGRWVFWGFAAIAVVASVYVIDYRTMVPNRDPMPVRNFVPSSAGSGPRVAISQARIVEHECLDAVQAVLSYDEAQPIIGDVMMMFGGTVSGVERVVQIGVDDPEKVVRVLVPEASPFVMFTEWRIAFGDSEVPTVLVDAIVPKSDVVKTCTDEQRVQAKERWKEAHVSQ